MDKNLQYLALIAVHIVLAFVVFLLPFLSLIYILLVFVFGIAFVVLNKNRNNEVLIVCAYITGIEVFTRATGGAFLYEFSKYGIILFMFLGIFYSSFSKNILPFILYLLLLMPALIYTTTNFILTDYDRKIISFTISGPLCLGVCAIYCYRRKINIDTLYDIILALGLPIVTITTYLILYTPSIKDVVTGTDSNGATSGGFGPNQVSTVVGLGIFIFFSRLLLQSKNKIIMFINIFIISVMAFRGIVTFSRGGILAAVFMMIALVLNLYFITNLRTKAKIVSIVVFSVFATSLIWGYSVLQTNGLIANRYAGQDAAGRVKKSKFTGREELVETELNIFYENPYFGCGLSRSIKIRQQETGIDSASHNEITRLLAEHGFLGLLILIILFSAPFFQFLNNRKNFFLIPFFLFWLLTINHAAMRIAAPAFVYAMCLIDISFVPIPQKKSIKK
jgi:O-antigen ligase